MTIQRVIAHASNDIRASLFNLINANREREREREERDGSGKGEISLYTLVGVLFYRCFKKLLCRSFIYTEGKRISHARSFFISSTLRFPNGFAPFSHAQNDEFRKFSLLKNIEIASFLVSIFRGR